MKRGIFIIIILTIFVIISGCIFFQPSRGTTTTQPTQNICEFGIPRYEIDQYGISTIIETPENYIVFGEPSQGIGDIGAALILTYQTTTDPNKIIVNTLGYGRREININNYRNINCVICPFSRDRSRPRTAELTGTYDGKYFKEEVNIPLDSFGIPMPFRVNLPDGSSQLIPLLAPDYIGSNNICSGYKLAIMGDKDTLNKILVVGQDACGGTSLQIYNDNNDIKQLVDNCESFIIALQQTSEIIQPTEILPIEYSCEDGDKRKPEDITEEFKFTRNEITIETKRGLQTIETRIEPDLCLPKHEGGWEIAEVYCNKLASDKYDEVLGYKYLECSEGCENGECIREPIDLGYIKVSGAVGNPIPFIGGPRLKAKAKLIAHINLDTTKNSCGNYEFESEAKIWIHKDAYKLEYDGLVKKSPGDLFNKKDLMPEKDYGSFVALIEVAMKDEIAIMKVKYKKASDKMPDDLDGFDMSQAIERVAGPIKITREDSLYQTKNKAIKIILTLYHKLLAKGIANQVESPKYEGNIVPMRAIRELETIDSKNEEYERDFDNKVQPIIDPVIDKKEYSDLIKKACKN